MLKTKEIREELREDLKQLFPDSTVLENLVPHSFQRPAFLLVCEKRTMDSINAALVDLKLEVSVTLFVEADPYHQSHVEALEERVDRLVLTLTQGCLRVKDRALDILQVRSVCGFDSADVRFTLQWSERRQALEEDLERMRQVHLSTRHQ